MLLLMRKIKGHASISKWTPEHAGKVGTPSMGGIAPLIALLGVTAWAYSISRNPIMPALMIGMAGFGLIGFIDDYWIPKVMQEKRGFGWTQKLILQIVVTVLMIVQLTHYWATSIPLAFLLGFLIIFFANAVNFSDGLDGLCGGLLILATLAFTRGMDAFSLAMIGALIPFLFLNAPPAKIFMGDVGALPLGACFGVMVWSQYTSSASSQGSLLAVVALGTISLVFILELCLVPMQLFWVKVFKKRLIPAAPVHQSFEKMGWPDTRITAVFLLTQLLLTILGLSILGSTWL
jgi:phospho-N-acetylmuramoyl-pentapeptide-transferase